MPGTGHFLVATCQIGAERALKQEIAREHPSLRPAFARPGLVTFKDTAADAAHPVGPGFALRSVFARTHAAALGPARSVDEVLVLARSVAGARGLRLHVFARDTHRPGEEPPEAQAAAEARVAALREALLAAGGATLFPHPEPTARPRDHVLDVVVAEDEPHFVGHHLHGPDRSPWPGGHFPVEVPPEAPSRAYRKLEEALAASRAPVAAGHVAVEIGSAPGGAALALLRRGLTVVGVDPGAMAEVVRGAPGFRHLAIPVGELTRELLPPRVDWLLLDVNLAPQVALHAVRGVVSALRPSLRGVLFTLKLNDWAMAGEVPELLRRVAGMGLGDVRARQLPSNRQEIFVYATRQPGPERARPPRRR